MPTTTQKFLLTRFLETLPLPDNIGAAEYRALHELLADLDSDDLDGNDLDAVAVTLTEVRGWAEDIEKRLAAFRERLPAPPSSEEGR